MEHRRVKLKAVLFILISLILFTIAPIVSYADYNGGQGSSNTGNLGVLNGGPSAAKTGIVVYIMKEDDNNPNILWKYTGAEIVVQSDKADEARMIPMSRRVMKTKLGDLIPNRVISFGHFENPVVPDGNGWKANGDAVKEWLLTEVDGQTNWQYIAQHYWSDHYDDIMADQSKFYLIFEPLAWMHPYKGNNGKDPGYNAMATAQGWADHYNNMGQPNGDKYINKMTHQALPYSMVLETPKFGLDAHAGESMRKLSYNEISGHGYGIHIIHLGDDSLQTTYDESQGDTPSPAPIESVGQITIVKNYREKDRTTNTKEEKGCYIRNSLSGKIEIEDEISYKVIGWAVSTTTTPSPTISSLTWESSIPNTITSTGTTPTTVDITTPSTCLYHVNAKNSN